MPSVVPEPTGIRIADITLVGCLHPPPGGIRRSSPSRPGPPGLVLGHGFPRGRGSAAHCGRSYPELGERLATETGWVVLTFNHRGTGESSGQFSVRGWIEDLLAAAGHLREQRTDGVWMAGAGTGGALALCAAAEDPDVSGVATLGAPADFGTWEADPNGLLTAARDSGAISDPDYPADLASWSAEIARARPLGAAAKMNGRPMLVIHGDSDDSVPTPDARALADTGGASAELRIVNGGGHLLRHDPRAVAVLMGWMNRHYSID
ncbi:MAG: alpha/beta hydrolase [Acidimicrobiales bacterium]